MKFELTVTKEEFHDRETGKVIIYYPMVAKIAGKDFRVKVADEKDKNLVRYLLEDLVK